MREIKFRVWDKKDNKMLFPEFPKVVSQNANSNIGYRCYFDSEYGSSINFTKDFILMQYTGFKDSEGIEIYEGDVVVIEGSTYKYPTHEVIFDSEGIWRLSSGFSLNAQKDKCKIIGNRFEGMKNEN